MEKTVINVSRYIKQSNTELRFDVEFITPAFLGGADQNAEIRTAPFKNLIRRWWRIANGNLFPEELWQKESELFGSTEIKSKSKVILEIEQSQVAVSNESEKSELRPFLYLGYGPVQSKDSETKKYIKPGSIISMKLLVPDSEKDMMINVLTLINLFGTVGSRSRKGFGSIAILPKPENEKGSFKLNNLKKLREELPYIHEGNKNILNDTKHYPYYLPCDEKGMLCWNTSQQESYKEVFDDLTEIYEKVVKHVESIPSGRVLIGSGNEIKNTGIKRIPSPLIMKVVKQGNKYSGRILHLVYNVSDTFTVQNDLWNSVYDYLDSLGLKRFGGAAK